MPHLLHSLFCCIRYSRCILRPEPQFWLIFGHTFTPSRGEPVVHCISTSCAFSAPCTPADQAEPGRCLCPWSPARPRGWEPLEHKALPLRPGCRRRGRLLSWWSSAVQGGQICRQVEKKCLVQYPDFATTSGGHAIAPLLFIGESEQVQAGLPIK